MLKIKRPFAVSGLGMLIVCALFLTAEKELSLAALIASAAATTVLTLKKSPYCGYSLLFTGAMVLACLLSSYFVGTCLAEQALEGREKQISGSVYDYPTVRQEGNFYVILNDCTVSGKEISGKIKAYIPHTAEIDIGEILSFSPSYIFSNISEGVFRYHTLSDGISFIATAELSEIKQLGTDDGYGFLAFIHGIKNEISQRILNNTDTENAAVIISLITGEKELLSEETKSSLRISGASHIFAISGMHLSVWTGIFFVILKNRSKSKIIPNLAALVFVIFYCIFTGLSPSVLRSGIMLTAVFIGRMLQRHADPLNSLGIAVSILLTLNPFLSGNVSFLLSAAATLALVAFIPGLQQRKEAAPVRSRYKKAFCINPTTPKPGGGRMFFDIRKLLSFASKSLYAKKTLLKITHRLKNIPHNILVSLSVILVTIPVCSVFFGYISLAAPFSSLIITPLAELLMLLSVPSAVFPSDSFTGDALAELTDFLSSLILEVNTFFAEFDFMMIPAYKSIVLPWFAVSTAAVIFIRFTYKNARKTLAAVLVCTVILSSVNAFLFSQNKNKTQLYIPGGENSTFISIIGNCGVNSAVYGCGGSFTAYRKTAEYLNRNAVLRLDALIVPRSKATESNNVTRMQNTFLPESLIELMPEKTNAAALSGSLWENAVLTAESDPDFSAAVLRIDSIKIVICSLPTSDFNTRSEEFRTADILITRSTIPDTLDTDNFKSIIVVTDRDIPLPSNAVSSEFRDIRITIEGDTYVID